ncbi:centrosomal protein of 170 kDa protein B isoform X3 [Melanotaenia boesemani]|uniref:centrosomal protein of 170 kDa protein B isoform X3 n=1 Tax=Melanotaenia boesemani TaxID=1250792 RepID=UPI001C03E9CB|nr:centrosomal protein of 170 kDa protein B isoform X3 [Melanotaenia boesemani]
MRRNNPDHLICAASFILKAQAQLPALLPLTRCVLTQRVAAGASEGFRPRDAVTAATADTDTSRDPIRLLSPVLRAASHALAVSQRVSPDLHRRREAEERRQHLEDALGFPSGSVKMSVTSWFLVSSSGTRHRLPREMIFVGREDCELMLQSRSVDKQHAVINYNLTTDEHLVKDLGSLNGTFVNDLRIPDQTYITLKLSDIIRFGYDSHVYVLEKSQHKVPEEALKHEKYSSQLQMSLKAAEVKKGDEEERPRGDKTSTKSQIQEAPVCRPTPLYGQPSWWGEEDYGNKVQSSEEPHPEEQKDPPPADPDFSGSLSDSQPKTVFPSYHREPSYFEIPTKDFQHAKPSGAELHEIPTKDTDTSPAPPSPSTPTPPVVQSHASFTIEFDDGMPGKIKIKDHITKFSTRQRKAQAPPTRATITAAPAEMMSAESKVADWLVHSDVSMMRKRAPCEDAYSTKSDLAMNIKTLKGHHHEDGTQSDSEDPVIKGRSKSHHSVQSQQSEASQQTISSSPTQKLYQPPQHSPSRPVPTSPVAPERPLSHSPPLPPSPTEMPKQGPTEHITQQAFIIEFFDDNPRKKRSQSFTHNPAHADTYSALKAKLERRKGGERPASVHGHIPPTQQVTVPLKGQGHSGPQRSSSLKREKTEGEAASSSSSSRSSPSIIIRPFGSVGKKSKLAQEFAAEFLKDSGQKDLSPTRDKTSPPPMSAPPVMMTPPHARIPSPHEPPAPSSVSYPSSPLQPPASSKSSIPSSALGQTASPVRQSGPPMSALLSMGIHGVDPKGSQRVMRNEEDDSLSDAGTYTIETECQDKEVEEARNMIDQVFGVLDSPEYSGVSTGVNRPVINDGKDEQANLPNDGSSVDPLHGFIPAAISGYPTGPIQVPAHVPGLEGPKWVSRWASLADSYAEPGSTPPQGECLEDLRFMSRSIGSYNYDNSESESSHSSRTRRLLPQVPPEKLDSIGPSILIRHEPYTGQELLDRVSGPPCPQDATHRLSVQDDVDPDSLSDASRSDDGPVLEKAKKTQSKTGTTSPGAAAPLFKVQEKVSPSPKSTSFYIGSEGHPGKPDQARSPVPSERTRDPTSKIPPTTVLIRHLSGQEPKRTGVKPNSSAPNLQTQDKDCVPTKDGCMSSFVRQESFTKDQPSDTVQMKKLPHISSHPSIRDMEQRRENIPDTQSFLQESEGTLSSLDTKFPSSGSGRSSKKGGSSSHMDDSLSGESDVDTASTVSQVSSKNAPISSASKKRPSISSLQKEKSSSSPSIQEKGRQLSARERLSEKRRNQTTADAPSKAEAAKRFQMRRSTGNRGSLDLSEGQQGSGPNWTETTSSDHEISRPSSRTKKLVAPLQKEDNGKTPKTATQQVLTRSNSLSAPRPTRASMLRRARLGEASDNEGTETDRASQNSDHITVPSKVSAEGKKLSRLDILAMPRKRTGSFTTPSDNETSSMSRSGVSNRNSESGVTVRKTSVGDARQAASRGSGAPVKQPLTRTRSSGAKYLGSGSRRRQKGSDFSSSSEEEYDTNTGSSKPKRSSHSTTSAQTPHSQRTAATRTKSVSLETEEDEDQNDVDPYQNWSTHSAEIAKLSQDLAKDLAILAKEIHDVAGDGDSPSSGMGTTTSPSSLPNTPASTISAREELVQHIPEASLNYQKVPPGSAAISDLDANMNEPEPSSKQRRPWNREEMILDNLMLNPVSQLSQAIRENTEQLAEKMKVLFQNKADVWEEIEAKINAENEVPILKTSNKEITSILKELRRVQRQLEVINTIVEPGGGLQAAAVGTSTRPSSKDKKPTTKPRTSNANESSKRPPRGPDGAHYMA